MAEQERKDAISATVHDVGVNMGDHGETIMRAIEVQEGETVEHLLERLIPPQTKWWSPRKYENFVTLRWAEPPEGPEQQGPPPPERLNFP